MSNIFQHCCRQTYLILKKILYHDTVIVVMICFWLPNVIKNGLCVRSVYTHNCWIYNSLLLGNVRCHGNPTASLWTCRVCHIMWPPTLRLSRCNGRRVIVFWIFPNMAAVRNLHFFKSLVLIHLTLIVVLTCGCVTNFIKIGSRDSCPDAHNCRMFNELLLRIGHCHNIRIVPYMSCTLCDVISQVGSQSVGL